MRFVYYRIYFCCDGGEKSNFAYFISLSEIIYMYIIMDEKIIKKTQETLGKIIKKPPLTDKLLIKPPFRFLHDIMTSVIKTTGFFKGLYTDHEMNSENVKDKDSKVLFLQKAIDVVCLTTGESLTVRPIKIVAGQEPEKTNELLQIIAKAIIKKLDSSDSVQRVLHGEKPVPIKKDKERKSERKDKERKEEKKERKPTDSLKKSDKEVSEALAEKKVVKERERSRPRKEDSKVKHVDSVREKEHEKEKSRKRESARDHDKHKSREKSSKDNDKEKHRIKSSRENKSNIEQEAITVNGLDQIPETEIEEKKLNSPSSLNEGIINRIKEDKNQGIPKEDTTSHPLHTDSSPAILNDQVISNTDESTKPIQRLQTARGHRKKLSEERNEAGGDGPSVEDIVHNRTAGFEPEVVPTMTGITNIRVRSARPSSARPAPPRIKKQEHLIEEPVRLGSAKIVTNVIEDKTEEEMEDDNFLVEEQAVPPLEEESTPLPIAEEPDEDGEHGGLVKKILETKKELEESSRRNATLKVEVDTSLMNDVARRKERERVAREIEKLQTWIQTLTRSANPLGKVMDYLQEDIDSMQKELEMWSQENKQHIAALKKEYGITENLVAPLKQQLTELEQALQDQQDQISSLKSIIIHNDEKIEKMVTSLKA